MEDMFDLIVVVAAAAAACKGVIALCLISIECLSHSCITDDSLYLLLHIILNPDIACLWVLFKVTSLHDSRLVIVYVSATAVNATAHH